MPNPFVHMELTTTDLKKSKEFYGKLFDWTLEDVPMPDGSTYTIIKVAEEPKPGGAGGGMFEMKGAPPIWVPYVLVDDVKTATEKAKSLGAHMIRENQEVPGMGWFSMFTDPQGAMIAVWQAKSMA